MTDPLDGARWRVLTGDCLASLRTLPDGCVHCCATSPPYWGLRDYGHPGQIGLEPTPEAYVARMVEVFAEVRRVLRDDGTCWLNLGDSYNAYNGNRGTSPSLDRERDVAANCRPRLPSGSGLTTPTLKSKDLVGIPWAVAFALRADGWYLRQDIIWHKPNPMPESVQDRCTKAHEYVFLLSKNERYWYDAEAIKENVGSLDRRLRSSTFKKVQQIGHAVAGDEYVETNGRNRRSVWTVATVPYAGAHFAVFPPKLVEPCILAGCPSRTCPACGAPHRRKTEKERKPTRPGVATKVTARGDGSPVDGTSGEYSADGRAQFRLSSDVTGDRDPQRHCTVSRTVGWEPGCACGLADTVPGIVLDPFGGSGTTAEVAVTLGRRALLCELNPDYVRLIGERMAHVQPPLPGMEPAGVAEAAAEEAAP